MFNSFSVDESIGELSTDTGDELNEADEVATGVPAATAVGVTTGDGAYKTTGALTIGLAIGAAVTAGLYIFGTETV